MLWSQKRSAPRPRAPSYEAAYRPANRAWNGVLRMLTVSCVVWEYRDESDPTILFVEYQVGSLITYLQTKAKSLSLPQI